jgi:hypothetical protein
VNTFYHPFRRTEATIVVDAGGDTLTLKRARGWKSTQIAESYSISNKIKISKRRFPLNQFKPSTSTEYTIANTSDLTWSGNFSISGNNSTMKFNLYDSNKTHLSNINNN